AVTNFLRQQLSSADKLPPAAQDELVRHLTGFAANKEVQRLLAESSACGISLRVMARTNLKMTPDSWVAKLGEALANSNAEIKSEAIAAVRQVRLTPQQSAPLAAALRKIGSDSKGATMMRVSALAAVPGGVGQIDPSLFGFLRSHLDAEQPGATRT